MPNSRNKNNEPASASIALQSAGAFRSLSLPFLDLMGTRKGDVATIPVTVTNQTDEVLTAEFSINTADSAKRFKSYELSTGHFVVVPGKSETRSIRVIIPETSTSTAERTAFLDAHLRNMTGQTLAFQGAVEVK